MIAIDNTDPAVPLLDIQANVAFGIPQLDVNGQLPLAQMPASLSIRESVTVATTYYVRTDGNDANDGKTNSALGAFLTIQKAFDVVTSTLDIAGGVTVTIQVADGTYSGFVMQPYIGPGNVLLKGNSTTPANVIISSTSASAVVVSRSTKLLAQDFKVQTTTSGFGFAVQNWSALSLSNIVFGACATGHMYADVAAHITVNGNYSIVGSSPVHAQLISGSRFTCVSKTVTLTGTPAFSTGFLTVDTSASASIYGNTYSGSATGVRYSVSLNGTIYTNNGGATYLPGSITGTTATGGQYA